MDDLDRREAFLLAIFANPDDDLPRLVFADWLEERGETAWAGTIRAECHVAHVRWANSSLIRDEFPRGFSTNNRINATPDLLADPVEFRRHAVLQNPEWYGGTELKVSGGKIASSKPIGTILNSSVTQRVAKLDLSGSMVGHGTMSGGGTLGPDGFVEHESGSYQLLDFEYRPVVTLQAVEALVSARECRRFTHLDLTNNDLDNDAARAILRSNYLTRIESLRLFDGNQLRGRTWAALQEKFGEGVVS